jgi:hypothetical protein
MALKKEMQFMQSIGFCPKGYCFSLSDLSTESEKKNQLCVLSVSSEAGGDILQCTMEKIL